MKKKLLTLGLAFCAFSLSAQVLLTDDFNYTAPNDSLQGNGWVAISGAYANQAVRSTANLSFPGYIGNGTAGSVVLNNIAGASAEDLKKTIPGAPFPSATDSTLYMSFLMNVASAPNVANATGTARQDHFIGFAGGTSTFVSRLYVQNDSVRGKLKIEMGKFGIPTFGATDYAFGRTYLVVLKYQILAGTGNDVASMWILDSMNGRAPGTEPTATTISVTGSDAASLDGVYLRQGSATPMSVRIDGIRVARRWADLFGTNNVNDVVNNTTKNFALVSNMVKNNITITANETAKNVNMQIFDLEGRIILAQNLGDTEGGSKRDINVADLTNGNYFVRLSTENAMQTLRFVVTK